MYRQHTHVLACSRTHTLTPRHDTAKHADSRITGNSADRDREMRLRANPLEYASTHRGVTRMQTRLSEHSNRHSPQRWEGGSGAVSPQKWDCIPSSVFAVSSCIIVYYPLSYPNRDTNCIHRITCIMLSITHVLHVCAKNVKYTRNTTTDTR